MLVNICSDYYHSEKVDKIFKIKCPRLLSLIHCNIRRLSKNLKLLKDMMYSLSEKQTLQELLKLNNTVTNIDLPGYKFYHVDSTTAAGGWVFMFATV